MIVNVCEGFWVDPNEVVGLEFCHDSTAFVIRILLKEKMVMYLRFQTLDGREAAAKQVVEAINRLSASRSATSQPALPELAERDRLLEMLGLAWRLLDSAYGGNWNDATREWRTHAFQARGEYLEMVAESDKPPALPGED